MGAPYVLSERDYLLLKRDHYTLQRELSNLKRSIARGPVRKHQGRSAPPPQIVQVWSSGSSIGDSIAVNADGLFPGRIRFLIDSTWNTGGDVWIEIIDDGVTLTTTASNGKYYPGTLSGTFTSGGTTAPLYLVTPRGTSATSGIPFYNGSSEIIPPFAVMYVLDEIVVAGVTYLDVIKPSAGFDIFWLVNGDTAVNPGATSNGYFIFDDARPVYLDSAAGTIGAGQELGPKPGSWGLWPGRPGFTAVGADYINLVGSVIAVDCKQRAVTRVFGRMYSTLTQNAAGNATATFEIWFRSAANGSRYPAGWGLVTVYAPLMNVGDTAPAGTMGYADYSTIGAGYWEVDPACDTDNTNDSYPPGQSANFQGFEDFQFSGGDTPTSTQSYAANH